MASKRIVLIAYIKYKFRALLNIFRAFFLSLHPLFKHFTITFMTVESFGFAFAEKLLRILLLTTDKSHFLGVPISNFWGPAQ